VDIADLVHAQLEPIQSRPLPEDDSTHLAVGLQGLTRELDAVLVIDHTTWERAQPAAAAFEKRPDVPIRGRRDLQDLYTRHQPIASHYRTLIHRQDSGAIPLP
jgi:hypothetical protein